MAEQIPIHKRRYSIIEGLFTWPSDDPRLIGGRCKTCNGVFFPKFHQQHKPDCKSKEVEEVLLSNKGELVSFTIMHTPPPPIFRLPSSQLPYAVGLIQLPEGLKIAGIITGCRFEHLKMHMNAEIVIEKLYEDEEGNDALTWKIRPL